MKIFIIIILLNLLIGIYIISNSNKGNKGCDSYFNLQEAIESGGITLD